jgi:hypothetical protein
MLDLEEGIAKLSQELAHNRLVVFVGSGISIPPPSNLPTWEGFIESFIQFCVTIGSQLPSEAQIDFGQILVDAKKYKSTDPLRVASVLRDQLINLGNQHEHTVIINIESQFKTWFAETFASSKPNEYHRLIAKTNYPYLLTTNYDTLLEKAFQESDSFKSLAMKSFTFTEADSIAASIFNNQFSIIHLHGIWNDIVLNNVVFTNEDYTKMLRRRYPGFTMCMQTIFLRYSTLFIGYGGSDPHVEDLLEEKSFNINYSKKSSKSYTVALNSKINMIQELHKEKRRMEYIGIDSYEEYGILLSKLSEMHPRS